MLKANAKNSNQVFKVAVSEDRELQLTDAAASATI